MDSELSQYDVIRRFAGSCCAILLIFALIAGLSPSLNAQSDDQMLILEDDSEDVLLIEEDDSDSMLLIEDDEASGDELIIDDSEPVSNRASTYSETSSDSSTASEGSRPRPRLDEVWLDLGHFTNSGANSQQQAYLHISGNMEWRSDKQWEFRVAARVDSLMGFGGENWGDSQLDYGDSYLRFRSEERVFTLGTQTIVWGRIDEFPPTDRLSTQDLRRFVIDDLDDRRLASPVVRYEQFFNAGKLDVVFYPYFREAELPHKESNWYPVNFRKGTILGLDTNTAIERIVRRVRIDENAPSSEGGIGVRFTSMGSAADFGVTLQKGRSTVPYFAYNPATNTVEGRYPRTSIVAGDVGFEALGGTLKFEAAWLSDTPATRSDGRYIETDSFGWGVALELFPGDGDARLNLQLTGQKLLDVPRVLDRENVYSFNGSYEVPFAEHHWRANTRFNIGLDERDIYLNPEIAYTGWDAQEAYLELHYFDGDKGTIGGFYEDNSVIAVGWRGSF